MKTKVISISLPEMYIKDIQNIMKEDGYVTVSEFIREAIRLKKREKLLKGISQSRKDYDEGKFKELKSIEDLKK